MRYTEGAACRYESRGIGLLAGAAYVVVTLDDAHLREVDKQDFKTVRWRPDYRLIVVKGSSGKLLVRFGLVDESGRFIRFRVPLKPPLHASLALLRADHHDPVEFIFQHLSDPVRRAHKVAKGFKRVGLLIGDETKNYSSPLSVEKELLIATDIEPRVAGGGGKEATVVEPIDEAEAQSVRQALRDTLTGVRLVADGRNTTNTQVVLAPLPRTP